MTIHNMPRQRQEREILRRKGQFWTPPWVAEAMVGYLVEDRRITLFDPAVGAGAFFKAGKKLAQELEVDVQLLGSEIDAEVLTEARESGLTGDDLKNVAIADFLMTPPSASYPGIVCNPPYIRHHRLSRTAKEKLRSLAVRITGLKLDGRMGLHIYFLIQSLSLLQPGGRLSFIMPSDTVEGSFAHDLWSWIGGRFCLETVITFDPEATPFPGVDTNAIIFMIRNSKPEKDPWWARCQKAEVLSLKKWVLAGFGEVQDEALAVQRRDLREALDTGLSRRPSGVNGAGPTLMDFCVTMRGIATGCNDFFFLTREGAADLMIPGDLIIPAVGRVRDIPGNELNWRILDDIAGKGRPTVLFSPDKRPLDRYPESVQRYLQYGSELGLPNRPLLGQRRPWYQMEKRAPPPFLFAYLGRRNARFIRNRTNAVPLTSFLCVYPRFSQPDILDRLWWVLDHPETRANIPLIAKSYGGGAMKVEPRALEQLPLPAHIIAQAGLPFAVTRSRRVSQPTAVGDHDLRQGVLFEIE